MQALARLVDADVAREGAQVAARGAGCEAAQETIGKWNMLLGAKAAKYALSNRLLAWACQPAKLKIVILTWA